MAVDPKILEEQAPEGTSLEKAQFGESEEELPFETTDVRGIPGPGEPRLTADEQIQQEAAESPSFVSPEALAELEEATSGTAVDTERSGVSFAPVQREASSGPRRDVEVQVDQSFQGVPAQQDLQKLLEARQREQEASLAEAEAYAQQLGADAQLRQEAAEMAMEFPQTFAQTVKENKEDVDRMMRFVDDQVRQIAAGRTDPERVFHSRGAGASFGAAMSVAVGQMVSILTGSENAALRIVESAIDRDLRAQQLDAQREGRAASLGLSLVDRLRGQAASDLEAEQMIRVMRLEQFKARVDAEKARAALPQQAAALDRLKASLDAKIAQERISMAQSAGSVRFKAKMRTTREELGAMQAAAQQQLAQLGAAQAGREIPQAQQPVEQPKPRRRGGISRKAVQGKRPEVLTDARAASIGGTGRVAVFDENSPLVLTGKESGDKARKIRSDRNALLSEAVFLLNAQDAARRTATAFRRLQESGGRLRPDRIAGVNFGSLSKEEQDVRLALGELGLFAVSGTGKAAGAGALGEGEAARLAKDLGLPTSEEAALRAFTNDPELFVRKLSSVAKTARRLLRPIETKGGFSIRTANEARSILGQ